MSQVSNAAASLCDSFGTIHRSVCVVGGSYILATTT
jgi:hypothetical protein